VGDAIVNTETGEETATMDDVMRPVFSPLGVAELTGKKCEYRKVRRRLARPPRDDAAAADFQRSARCRAPRRSPLAFLRLLLRSLPLLRHPSPDSTYR
jgi:hypothetical protein